MNKIKNKKKSFVVIVAFLLIIAIGFSGCMGNESEDDGNGGSGDLSGTDTYSGTWTGTSPQGAEISGTWEFDVDFDEGNVTGTFSGDASGNIEGTVSGGTVDAEGDAAMGTVTWSGEFSNDGSDVSGNWEFKDVEGSGTWTGSIDN